MENGETSARALRGERIDDLQTNGLRLIQRPDGYCFTTDAVLLAAYPRVRREDVVCDFCTGNGVVLVLTLGKYQSGAAGFGVEIDGEAAERAERNLALNGLERRAEILHADVKDAPRLLAGRGVTLITANPPYRKRGEGAVTASCAACRHELLLTAEGLFDSASRLLTAGGRFALVHRADRMAELLALSYRFRLTPKRLRPVAGRAGANPHLFLLEAVKDGKDGVKVEPTLFLRNADGSETEEVKTIYGGGN